MPGGGANWVNYMTWCYYHNKILTDVPAHFGLTIVCETFSNYGYVYWLQHHDRDPNDSDIVFGSQRYGINLLFNNITKNSQWTFTPGQFLTYTAPDLDYNLDWALIVEDPEQFVKDLNCLGQYDIKFNSIVEQAFGQYLTTAYPHPLLHGDQYRGHPWIMQIFNNTLQNLIPKDISTQSQKIEAAWNMIDAQWVKYYPDSWHS
jgi:hypothetical protein